VTRGLNQNPFYPEDDPSFATKIPPLQIYTTIDGEYLRTMGIPLIAGRTFERLDAQRHDEAIISQATAVQFWKDSTGQRVLGKRFRDIPNGSWYTIVGVVGNARDTALAAPPSQAIYFPEVPSSTQFNSKAQNTMALVLRTVGEPTGMTRAVQRTVRELDPTLPLFDVRPMASSTSFSMEASVPWTISRTIGSTVFVVIRRSLRSGGRRGWRARRHGRCSRGGSGRSSRTPR
jgi:putative ABC transport system permease protein